MSRETPEDIEWIQLGIIQTISPWLNSTQKINQCANSLHRSITSGGFNTKDCKSSAIVFSHRMSIEFELDLRARRDIRAKLTAYFSKSDSPNRTSTPPETDTPARPTGFRHTEDVQTQQPAQTRQPDEVPNDFSRSSPYDNRSKVFRYFIDDIAHKVDTRSKLASGNLKAFLGTQCENALSRPESISTIKRWSNGDRNLANLSVLELSELQQIVDLAYVFCCDTMGPVRADQIISEAISSTEKLPESQDFPPQNLL